MLKRNLQILLSTLLAATPAAAQSSATAGDKPASDGAVPAAPSGTAASTTPAGTTPAPATSAGAAPAPATSAGATPTATAPSTPAAPATPEPAAAAAPAAGAAAQAAPEASAPATPEPPRGPSGPLGLRKGPESEEFKFGFHGYFRAPMRVGRKQRGDVLPGQSSTSYHEPLLVDDQRLNWLYTRAQERSWAELLFSYGNSHVTGFVSVQASNFDDWEHYSDAQLGIAQGWVAIHPNLGIDNLQLEWDMGSFWEKFGEAGQYDAGPYDTYLFGRTHQLGESLKGDLALGNGDIVLHLEHGIGGHGEQAPPEGTSSPVHYDVTSSLATNTAFTLLNHAHAGISYRDILDVNLHYLNAFDQDGLASNPDGSVTVLGPEARVNGGLFGNLYVGYSYIKAKNAIEVGPVLEVIHSLGGGGGLGTDLTSNYFDLYPAGASSASTPMGYVASKGNGSIGTLEFNYEYSFGLLWRELSHPGVGFNGEGADVRLGIFGMYTTVKSNDVAATDGIKKLKFGTDINADLLPWFGVGLRYDNVQPNTSDSTTKFSVISPRLTFRSNWHSHERVSLIWSHYTYGDSIAQDPPLWATPGFNGPQLSYGGGAASGVSPSPPFWTTSAQASATRPDANVIALKAEMWW